MSEVNSSTRNQLKAFIERIERLEEEKAALAGDIKEVYAEAKGTGFDPRVIRTIVSRRRQNQEDLEYFETVLETYLEALGNGK